MVLDYNNDLFLLPSETTKVIFDYSLGTFLVKVAPQAKKITIIIPGETRQLTITTPELVWFQQLYRTPTSPTCESNCGCSVCFANPDFVSTYRLFITTNDNKLTAYDLANIAGASGNVCWGKKAGTLFNLREASNKFWMSPFNMDYYSPSHSPGYCDRTEHIHHHSNTEHTMYGCLCCREECSCICKCGESFIKHIQNYNQDKNTSNPTIEVKALLNLKTSVGYESAEGIFVTRNSKIVPNIKFEDIIMIKNENTKKYEPLIIGAVFKHSNGWKMHINNNEYLISDRHINICALNGRPPKEMSTLLLIENELMLLEDKLLQCASRFKQFIKTY